MGNFYEKRELIDSLRGKAVSGGYGPESPIYGISIDDNTRHLVELGCELEDTINECEEFVHMARIDIEILKQTI